MSRSKPLRGSGCSAVTLCERFPAFSYEPAIFSSRGVLKQYGGTVCGSAEFGADLRDLAGVLNNMATHTDMVAATLLGRSESAIQHIHVKLEATRNEVDTVLKGASGDRFSAVRQSLAHLEAAVAHQSQQLDRVVARLEVAVAEKNQRLDSAARGLREQEKELEALTDQLAKLNGQVQAHNIASADDVTRLEAKLDGYIARIDWCVARWEEKDARNATAGWGRKLLAGRL